MPTSSSAARRWRLRTTRGENEQTLSSNSDISAGDLRVRVEYTIEGHDGISPTGTARLLVDGEEQDHTTITTQPAFFSLSGEGATVGREVGQPVSTAYTPPFDFHGGTIHAVTVSGDTDHAPNHELRAKTSVARD